MSFPKQVLEALNKARQNPQSFIPQLQEQLKYFNGNKYSLPGKITLITNEGPKAVKECISFLEQAKPIGKLQWNDNMSKAAQDHANDIGPKGIVGHDGSNKSTMTSRLENLPRYGDWCGQIGENISFGESTPEGVIVQLITDDGVSSRGHRNNIFNPNYQFCGIGSAKHKTYEICVVQDFAAEYSEKGKQMKMPNQEEAKISQEANDPNVVKTSTSTETKTTNGKKVTKVTTTYTMKDGSIKTTVETTTEG